VLQVLLAAPSASPRGLPLRRAAAPVAVVAYSKHASSRPCLTVSGARYARLLVAVLASFLMVLSSFAVL
jgi:hypothetical protein